MRNSEIVFELGSDESWEYYVADHDSQHLFWLDEHSVSSYIEGGDESLAHLSKFATY